MKTLSLEEQAAEQPLVQALNEVMAEFDISGTHLAKASGVSMTQVSLFRNGKTDLASSNLVKIVRALPQKARHAYLEKVFLISIEERSVHQVLADVSQLPPQEKIQVASGIMEQLKKPLSEVKSSINDKTGTTGSKMILDGKQMERLSLVLEESLRYHGLSPHQAARQSGASPELIQRILFYSSTDPRINFGDYAFSTIASLCCVVLSWSGNQPRLDFSQTYSNYQDLLVALENGSGVKH